MYIDVVMHVTATIFTTPYEVLVRTFKINCDCVIPGYVCACTYFQGIFVSLLDKCIFVLVRTFKVFLCPCYNNVSLSVECVSYVTN